MTSFLTGLLFPLVAQLAWIGWTVGRFGVIRRSESAALAILLVVVPLLAAFGAAQAIRVRRPRRLLLAGARAFVRQFLYGVLAGTLSLGLMAVSMLALDKHLPDWALAGLCTFVTTAAMVWVLPAPKAGVCVRCNYDVRGSLSYGRCPECGTGI